MTTSLAEAMRLATDTVRAGDPGRATEIIQRALNGHPATAGPRPDPLGDAGSRPVLGARLRLGETLARLREGMPGLEGLAGGLSARGTGTSRDPALRETDFPRHTFTCAAGSRDYHLHVPDMAGGRPKGLVVMLHGCTQTPADFALGTGMNARADRHGLIVAYPAQARGANMQSCWNWFAPGDQARDGGEPAILAGLTAGIVANFDVPPDQVFVAGLSAGAAMAVILGRTHPEIFAAVGAHSGLAYRSAHDVPSAFAAMRGQGGHGTPASQSGPPTTMPTIIFHGESDQTVQPSNAARIAGDVLTSASGQQVETTDNGTRNGRAFTRTVTMDARGTDLVETWQIAGLGHAWSGGNPSGSYADAAGPDASAEMVRFFLEAAAA